jgi:DNA-binding response OmpR family regulator
MGSKQTATGKKLVLMIDDDPVITDMARVMLIRAGYRVHAVTNGPDGLEMARALKPDIVILDRIMPHMNGDEVLKQFKSSRSLKSIPVVMLTSDNHVAGIIKTLDLGAEDYIIKPFIVDDFMVRIHRVVQGWRRPARTIRARRLTQKKKVATRKTVTRARKRAS